MPTRRENPLIYDDKKWEKLQRNRGRPALPLPPVQKSRLHLVEAPLLRKRKSHVVPNVEYRYRSALRSKRALGILALSAVAAVLLLAYGQPYIETYVTPYLEKIREELRLGSGS